MRAVVAGGGIGGLAAAVALRKAGAEVVVLERAAELHEVGAGLVMSGNAMLALERIGLAGEVRSRGAVARRAHVKSRRGRVLLEIPFAERGWETMGIHRAELQGVLLDALPVGVVRLKAEVVRFEEVGRRVRVDGEEADLLVGADGINSTVRRQLWGDEPKRYAGHVGWRAVTEFEHPLVAATFSESWGPGARFGLVPIGRGRLYWFVAEAAREDGVPYAHPKEEFLRRFADWHEPIREAIESTDESGISRTPIYDRKPRTEWGRGRVTLLGDAAHAMTPNLGQGAAQSLEDAVVLGACLRGADDVEAALREYERRRRKRANAIVAQSWQAGKVAQLDGARACALRDAVVRLLPRRVTILTQSRLQEVELPSL